MNNHQFGSNNIAIFFYQSKMEAAQNSSTILLIIYQFHIHFSSFLQGVNVYQFQTLQGKYKKMTKLATAKTMAMATLTQNTGLYILALGFDASGLQKFQTQTITSRKSISTIARMCIWQMLKVDLENWLFLKSMNSYIMVTNSIITLPKVSSSAGRGVQHIRDTKESSNRGAMFVKLKRRLKEYILKLNCMPQVYDRYQLSCIEFLQSCIQFLQSSTNQDFFKAFNFWVDYVLMKPQCPNFLNQQFQSMIPNCLQISLQSQSKKMSWYLISILSQCCRRALRMMLDSRVWQGKQRSLIEMLQGKVPFMKQVMLLPDYVVGNCRQQWFQSYSQLQESESQLSRLEDRQAISSQHISTSQLLNSRIKLLEINFLSILCYQSINFQYYPQSISPFSFILRSLTCARVRLVMTVAQMLNLHLTQDFSQSMLTIYVTQPQMQMGRLRKFRELYYQVYMVFFLLVCYSYKITWSGCILIVRRRSVGLSIIIYYKTS